MTKPPVKKPRPDQQFSRDVPNRILAPLGRLVVVWSKLEAALEDVIWHFLDVSEDDGRLITCRLDARPKVEILRALGARYLGTERADQVNAVLTKIAELQEVRNLAVHATWGSLMPEEIPVALSLRRKAPSGNVIAETFPISRLEKKCAEIEECLAAVVALRDALASSRKREPKPFLP